MYIMQCYIIFKIVFFHSSKNTHIIVFCPEREAFTAHVKYVLQMRLENAQCNWVNWLLYFRES